MSSYRIFISSVSDELGGARRAVARALRRKELAVRDQEHSRPGPATLLEKLRDDIAGCDAVICLVGERAGLFPSDEHVKVLGPVAAFAAYTAATGQTHASLTQWEFLLAKQLGKKRYVFLTRPDFAPDKANDESEALRASQRAFRQWLHDSGEHYSALGVEAALIEDILVQDFPSLKLRRPNSLPYASLGPLFKGRDRVLAELHRNFERRDGAASAIVGTANALHGLGGIGKTRLAVEYAWHHARDYAAHLFVGAETPADLRRNLAAQCGRLVLDLPEQEAKEEDARVAAALAWLQTHDDWLVILDNADTKDAAAAVQALLPQLTHGRVLITGRWSEWSAAVKPLPLDVLAPDDAATFLLERTDGRRRKTDGDAAEAATLAGELGCLALALEQAGAYIARHKLTFAGYLAAWRENRTKALAWFDEQVMHYPRSVAATWQTSFDGLREPARRLLQRLAWLAPEPIPESLLDVALPNDGDDLRAALAELEAFSLVARASDTPEFTVHRLVQFCTRAGQETTAQTRSLAEALEWITAAFVGDPLDVRSWTALDPLTPHAAEVSGHADSAGIRHRTSSVLARLGSLFFAKALYRQAEPLLRRALEIDESAYGPEDPHVAARLGEVAKLLQATNHPAEAEPLFRRALAIDERRYGPEHPRVAVDLNDLANLLEETNRLAEAEQLMRRALAIGERSYGPEHPHVGTLLNNLARLLRNTNHLAESEPLMRRALAIDEKCNGPEHPSVAVRLGNLAVFLEETNRRAEAETLMRRALAIDERSYGPEHPKVGIRLGNLALLLQYTGRHEAAEPLTRRALAIAERCHGPEHPDVGVRINDLAILLYSTGRLAEAEPLMRRALAIGEKSYGSEHPDVAVRFNNLAQLLKSTNRPAEAEPLIRRAISIHEKSFGRDHPDVAIDLNNLARLLQAGGRLPEAEPQMRRALAIFAAFGRKSGHEHSLFRKARRNYEDLLAAMGKSETEIATAIDDALRAPPT